ncbi:MULTISPECIES: SoxR reducing system RseC family protein [unclassified Clostridium]|uniref:SoxR reducing system RseC family protein n=1 Tax=unclassified Clostridium TaxID=2614128 RepID=UPI000297EC67|nr:MULTISPECIES: SoxR reducing system RseC family protein [unclassified Clostridium]EKQ56786.1 MAG: Positive regulator of sigma E activity [Clostridium sp. Maddingley MBC34-26]
MKIEDQEENITNCKSQSGSKEKKTNMLVAAFIIFIFPIISILVGAFIGGYLGTFIDISTKISEIIGGILGFALSAVIIKLFDKSAKADEKIEKIHWDDL